MVNITDKQRDVIEDNGWSIYEDDNTIELSQSSLAGEDFSFTVCATSPEELVNQVRDYASDFDAEEHVVMWIEAKNNGVSGIPNIHTLVRDADEIQEMLIELAIALSNTIALSYI